MKLIRMTLPLCILVACRVDGHYVLPESHILTIQVGGSGAGSVSSEPSGLTCSAGTCSGEFFVGTVVRLSASALTGSFLGWTEACRGRDECTITMDRDQVTGALFGTPGEALWARQLGSEESDYGKAIAIDSDNNLIAVGAFSRTIVTGSELTSNGFEDIYIVKFASSTGEVVWARRFGGTSYGGDGVFGVTVDRSNNIYIFGFFAGSVDFGGGPLMAPVGGMAAFVLKLDSNGSFGWVRKFDGQGFAYPGTGGTDVGSIATDGDSVVVAGKFDWMIVDTTTLMSVGAPDIFALTMSASTGATLWAKRFGGTESDYANGASLDGNGNVVLTGGFSSTVHFGNGPLSASGPGPDGFLLKLDGANGATLLSGQFGSPGAVGNAVAVDSENNILITGMFQATADLGCATRPTASQADAWDALLVKYTQAGSCIWAKGFGGVPTTSPLRNATSIAVNNPGEISIAGGFRGSISLGGEFLLSASGSSDVFAARFDSEGMHLTSGRSGGTASDEGHGIAQSLDGRFFVTGRFQGFAEFGNNAFNAIGAADDAFVVGFAPL